jgi:hypothetical protein
LVKTGTADVSSQIRKLGDGIPEGRRITFVGDEIIMPGKHFRFNMNVFFGTNLPLTRRPDSLYTFPRHRLPNEPLVYTNPESGVQTTLEVTAPVQFNTEADVRIRIPAGVACTDLMTNPTLRLYGDDGSSFPTEDVFHVVGPIAIAVTPNKLLDIGGESVIVHGDFFSQYTQIGFSYIDPRTEEEVVLGLTPETDIEEIRIDRHTLVIPEWPGIVKDTLHGLAEEVKVKLLVHENIEAITTNSELEPLLEGEGACFEFRAEGEPVSDNQNGEIPYELNGVRNSSNKDIITIIPTGVTDYPSIAGIVPEWGTMLGGNTVVIHGDQFDGFTVDLSDPENPGIAVECPPGSGDFIAPLSAILVDRQTIVLKMPPCSVFIPRKVDFCLTNKFSMDNPIGEGQTTPDGNRVVGGDCVVFEDIYEYRPVPVPLPAVVTAIYPVSGHTTEKNTANDYGLQKLLVVGEWFDAHTEMDGGFEFIMPDGTPLQTERTIVRNRNLLEIYTKRLPTPPYPLTENLTQDDGVRIRVRNVTGHNDQVDPEDSDAPYPFAFVPLEDAGEVPELHEICGTGGPYEGGNQIMVFGEYFDTSTDVRFSGVSATAVQFVSSTVLIATVPSADEVGVAIGDVSIDQAIVQVVDNGEGSVNTEVYTYGEDVKGGLIGYLAPNHGSATGGYDILAYGVDLSPLTRIEFGEGDGNFSPNVHYLGSNLLLVEVPEAFPAQIGATVDVGATDPLNGLTTSIKTVEFTYDAANDAPPEILWVDTNLVDPVTPTDLPALHIDGGQRMLIIGRNFNQKTTFDITKPQGSSDPDQRVLCGDIEVLTPNLALCVSPASPDGKPGIADLQAHNDTIDSNNFPVEYVERGPPAVIDVRNLDTGDQEAPIDANDRLVIFGDNFVQPVSVNLTGCRLSDQETTITVPGESLTLVEDHIIGVNIPRNTFCEGPLQIEVVTPFGSAFYETLEDDDEPGEGEPIFTLVGPQAPKVLEVFESNFNSGGGEEAIFYGRNFTSTTEFTVRTPDQANPMWKPVLAPRFVSENVVIFNMPPLPGGVPTASETDPSLPNTGANGSVRAEEMDTGRRQKINGEPFTVSDNIFTVVNDEAAMLLGIHPNRGSIDGGEQVLLFGAHFLKETGESNVEGIRFEDQGSADLGEYVPASPGDLPLDETDMGKYVILNDHEILLITNGRDAIADPATEAPANVFVDSQRMTSSLFGGYIYQNTPAVIRPHLHGVTPNETRLNGGSSHLVSGGFLAAVDKLRFERVGDDKPFEILSAGFEMVTDEFIVFIMPDLSTTYNAGDILNLRAFKTLPDGTVLESENKLIGAMKVTFAGPPMITPTLTPPSGSAFGGNMVEIKGALFTNNSQVLFGTIPARVVVNDPANSRLLVFAPNLPVKAPGDGVSLQNIDTKDGTVDIAVFTQGGWAVLPEGYEFTEAAPTFDSCSEDTFHEGETKHVVIKGGNFVPNIPGDPAKTKVTVSAGTVANLVVHDFDMLSFDYTAPTGYAAGTVGPKTESAKVVTNMGEVAACDFSIVLDPFITSAETTYAANNAASPSTGVADGAIIEVTLEGGNFQPGGTLTLVRGGTTSPIVLDEVTGAFTKGGQWKYLENPDGTSTELVFSAPNIFSADSPTLLEGNRNIGPVGIKYTNTVGNSDTLEPAYSYVASIVDFEIYSFTTPQLDPVDSSLDKLSAAKFDKKFAEAIEDGDYDEFYEQLNGDINGDTVPDIVILVRNQGDTSYSNDMEDSDAVVYIADTFGAGVDINGDGESPDFAGTYTKTVISNDSFKTHLYINGRGGLPRIANLDGEEDEQMEIVLPGVNDDKEPVLLIIDVNSDGSLGSEHLVELDNVTPDSPTAVAGIAVGRFDDDDSRPDIAILIGSSAKTERKLVIFASTGTDFVYDDTAFTLDSDLNNRSAGFLESGDFDGQNGDDLIWGLNGSSNSPIVVATVDATTGTVTSQDMIDNIKGGAVPSIVTADIDGDGEWEAFVLIEDNATGDLAGPSTAEGGVAIILDPMDFEADAYVLTGFIDNGRGIGAGDFNGDGNTDLSVVSNQGELIVLMGDSEGEFAPHSRSWIVPTVSGFWPSRVHGLATADLNRDGLTEVFVGDIGINPMSLIVWLNTAR